MNFECNLQLEFKNRKNCDKLENFILKDEVLNKCFDCRLDNTIMFKFNSKDFRNQTLSLLKRALKYSRIRTRNTGVDYLYIPRL